MKLDIEAMAREARFSWRMAGTPERDFWTATEDQLEAFARLIVERCAQEAKKHWEIDGSRTAEEFAAAIRNLLE